MNFYIKSIKLSDGKVVSLPEGGLIIFVGPNNVGKSTALEDINNAMYGGADQRVIREVVDARDGDGQDLVEWLDSHVEKQERSAGQEYTYARMSHNGGVTPSYAKNLWNDKDQPIGHLWPLMSLYLDALARLQQMTQAPTYELGTQNPTQPLQYLWKDETKREELNQIAEEVFNTPISLYPYGPSLKLHLGKLEIAPSPYPDDALIATVKQMPELDHQGHGMRSFMYLMLVMMVRDNFCVLIDEPEVFLHPPQALALGKRLRKASKAQSQVFVSTHSTDIVRGALSEKAGSPVMVIRLTREDKINHASVLEPEDIEKLWADPITRYSNLLDGLFHHTTVLCEGDADCKFYSAVLEKLGPDGSRYSPEDLHFTYSSGKDRMANMAAALNAVDVRVRAIADIDLLRKDDIHSLEKLIIAQGGEMTEEIRKHLGILDAGVRSLDKKLTQEFVKQELAEISSELATGDLESEQKKRINRLLQGETGWAQIKRGGKGSLPAGNTITSFEWLVEKMKELGIFVVEVGEVERFVPQVAAHGPAWLAEVLEKGLESTAASGEAGALMATVASRHG